MYDSFFGVFERQMAPPIPVCLYFKIACARELTNIYHENRSMIVAVNGLLKHMQPFDDFFHSFLLRCLLSSPVNKLWTTISAIDQIYGIYRFNRTFYWFEGSFINSIWWIFSFNVFCERVFKTHAAIWRFFPFIFVTFTLL